MHQLADREEATILLTTHDLDEAEKLADRILILAGGQLAEALDVHYQTVGYLERGEYSPSLHLALRIAAYFEVPVEVIFSTEPFPRIGSVGASAS